MALRVSLLCVVVSLLGLARSQKDPNCAPGRHVIVHLFEWKWKDIEQECERFLAPKGFCGVQVSPPNEHRIITGPFRPWYERYQPVSYKLQSRSGDEQDFRQMVSRCNSVGVRIYADAVINHMTGGGWGEGTAGSHWNADTLDFHGVPYGPWDFNSCETCGTRSCEIEDYNNVHQVRNCQLSGLRDLKLDKDYVRKAVADYLNKLIDIGVAGFRVDASKHMWPGDMENIFSRLKNLNTKWFQASSRPFIFMEVIAVGNEAIQTRDYTHMGRVTEFKFGYNLGNVIRKNHNQKLAYLKNFGEGWSMLPLGDALVFIDNHDNQRGHGAGGFGTILTFFEHRMYKMAMAFMLAYPYGTARLMSSYFWDRYVEWGKDVNDWKGPPSDGSGRIDDVIISHDGTCEGRWMCEHRWHQVFSMVQFRAVVDGQGLSMWWDNGNNQIAFSRGNKGFIAINNDNYAMDQWIDTNRLPPGTYCDVISGEKVDSRCTGRSIHVNNDGWAHVVIDHNDADPMVAIHVMSKI